MTVGEIKAAGKANKYLRITYVNSKTVYINSKVLHMGDNKSLLSKRDSFELSSVEKIDPISFMEYISEKRVFITF